MAYGQLYSFEYKDFLSRLTTAKIFRDGYTEDSSEILAAGDPVIIESKTDNNYLFTQLYGTTCQLNLISETNLQFADLFSASAFKHKVEIWKEPEPDEPQELFWIGFILPDQYSEPFDYIKNYPVSVTCRDMVGGLKEIDFLQDSGNEYVGKQQVIRIIAECLKKTRLQLNINFATDLIENNTLIGTTGDPLELIFLDYAVFYKDNKKGKYKDTEYVLKQILQSLGCKLVQSDGEWWIEKVVLLTGSHTVYKYDYNGIFQSSSLVNQTKTYTGKYDLTNNRIFFAEKQGLLEINPAFKGFVINQDYGKLPSVLKNYSFDKYTETVTYSGRGIPSYTTIIENWNEYPSGTYDFRVLTKDDKTVLAPPFELDFDNTIYVQSDSIYLTFNEDKGIKVTFTYKSYKARMRYEIKVGSYWINATTQEFSASQVINIAESSLGEWADMNIIAIPEFAISGYLYVRIYHGDIDGGATTRGYYLYIDNFLIDFPNDYPEGAQFDVILDFNNNEKPDEIDSILGDLPELTDNEDIYIGGYWYFDGMDFIPTRSWTVPGSGRNLVLLAWLAENINDQYITPKQRISGRMIGNFGFNSSLLIPFMTNKIYLPNRLSLSDKYCNWTVEMIELLNGEDWGGRVLATYDDKVYATYDDKLIKV